MKSFPVLLIAVLLPLCACAKDAAPVAVKPVDTKPADAVPVDAKDPRWRSRPRPGTGPDLRATPVPGIFELTHGADVTCVTADGKFAFSGDLYHH
jgi:hypothetical protein